MGTLENIINAIYLLFGFLSLLFIYYLAMFVGWIKAAGKIINKKIFEKFLCSGMVSLAKNTVVEHSVTRAN